jgi:hypothetical protein
MLPDKLKMRPIRRYRGGRVVGFHSRAIWGLRGMTGNALRQRVFGGAVLVCVALAYALILWTNLAGTGADHVVDVQPPPPVAMRTALRCVYTTNAPRPGDVHAARIAANLPLGFHNPARA